MCENNFKFNLAVTELNETFKILATQYDNDSKKFSPGSVEQQVNKALSLAYKNSQKIVNSIMEGILK